MYTVLLKKLIDEVHFRSDSKPQNPGSLQTPWVPLLLAGCLQTAEAGWGGQLSFLLQSHTGGPLSQSRLLAVVLLVT